MAIQKKRGSVAAEPRPYVFPTLKVDGQLHQQEISIPNTGQGFERATQQAAQKVRQMRAAEVAAAEREAMVVASSAVAVDATPVMEEPQALDVGGAVREWLALHLPSTEQLFAASASMVGLQGIDARVRDLVASFQEALDGYRSDFTSWRDSVASEWAGIVSSAGELLAAWGAKVDEVDAFKAALEKDLRAYVGTLRGPKGDVGNTGMAGAAVTVVDRLPKGKGIDFTRPFLKRDAVVGDICIDGSTDMRYGWRWDGQSWERGPAMTSLQVRDVRVNSVQGAPQYTTLQIVQPGSGSGGGGELLKANRLAYSASTEICDSSNWAGVDDPLSGTLELEVRALDGTLAGRSAVCVATFDFDGTDQWQEYALAGDLANVYGINLSMTRGPATAPVGLTGVAIPPGTSCLRIFASVQLEPGVGNPGATNFKLAGSVEWNRKSVGRAYRPTDELPKPLWIWG